MKRIYSNQSTMLVHHVKNVLDNHGIDSEMRGEHLADASGGVAPIDAWIELWITDESKHQEATEIVDNILRHKDNEAPFEDWLCPNCGEEIEGVFAVCWNCGTEQQVGT